MKRCVIVGGAPIADCENIRSHLTKNDFFVFCDCGLHHREALGVTPDLIVGDFDSHEKPNRSIETIILPREKDDTDTFFAAKEGIKRGFDDFLLIGAVGGRLDHSLGNISILLYLHRLGKNAKIIDDHSVMEIISGSATVDCKYPYFSLLSIDGTARGVSIQNAKFPLDNAEIGAEYQYGISNEVLGDAAKITVKDGVLLLVKVKKT